MSEARRSFWFGPLSLAAIALSVQGQTLEAPRIGFLSPASASSMAPRVDAFRQGLRELGYIEGRSIVTHYRWAEGNNDRLHGLAGELVRQKVSMLVVHGVTAAQAARKASATLPVVCFACGDLLSTGLVASLARPGGNLTGLTILAPDASGKRIELLREVMPRLHRLAALWNSANPVSVPELQETETAARALGIQLISVSVAGPDELQSAFASISKARADALIVLSDAMLYGRSKQVALLAAANGLPTISWSGEFAKAGGLIGYGPDVFAIARRSATYVDKVLKGAKPADLPIEQPTKFEFVVNLRTAQGLGLTIPPSLLVRADEVIR